MLPPELRGPGRSLWLKDPAEQTFVSGNVPSFPELDPAFILQMCYELPRRFDDLYPGFDTAQHAAVRVERSADWVDKNVRYQRNEKPGWGWHVDEHFNEGAPERELLDYMLARKTWPLPPIIVEATLARKLGASHEVGVPYDLVEGTHRISYLDRLLALGKVEPASRHILIEIVERGPAPS